VAAAAPVAAGPVLAQLVTPDGRLVPRSTVRGQLHVTDEELVILRPTLGEQLFHRSMIACLVVAWALVAANLVLWKRMEVLWAGVALMGLYTVTLPARRRLVAPRPLDAAALAGLVAAGRAALRVPRARIIGVTAPEAGPRGLRTPARLTLPDGALELWLDAAAFAGLRHTLRQG
jgi:hypothetical protein